MKASATKMSKDWLSARGYLVERTEQTIRVPDYKSKTGWKIWKRDLLNFADLLVLHKDKTGVTFVQCTVGMNHKDERMAKILGISCVGLILRAYNRIELHVWRKKKKQWTLARYHLQDHRGILQWTDDLENVTLFNQKAANETATENW